MQHPNPKMAQFERLCRERGLPVTVQRRAVLEATFDRTDHPSADRIFSEVHAKLPGISRASVYRILDLLVDFGLLLKLSPPGLSARFDPTVRWHHHLACRRCGRVVDIEVPGIDALPLPDGRALGFQIDGCQIHFSGLCAACAKKNNQHQHSL